MGVVYMHAMRKFWLFLAEGCAKKLLKQKMYFYKIFYHVFRQLYNIPLNSFPITDQKAGGYLYIYVTVGPLLFGYEPPSLIGAPGY